LPKNTNKYGLPLESSGLGPPVARAMHSRQELIQDPAFTHLVDAGSNWPNGFFFGR